MSKFFWSLKEKDELLKQEILSNFWERVNVMEKDDCWEWQGGINTEGYPIFCFSRKGVRKTTSNANKLSLELLLERPLKKKFESAHKCRIRHCVNPNHLEEKTHHQNTVGDKLRDGTYGFKLTPEDVIRIYNDKKTSGTELAKEFGVNRSTISKIRNGVRWNVITQNI